MIFLLGGLEKIFNSTKLHFARWPSDLKTQKIAQSLSVHSIFEKFVFSRRVYEVGLDLVWIDLS